MPSSQHLFSSIPPQPPLQKSNNDSDLFLSIAGFLCALICTIGLAILARWTCFRSTPSTPPPPPPPKGLTKSALKALPKTNFQSLDLRQHVQNPKNPVVECPICLSGFENGDEIRILPGCGHSFHVICVDAWLRLHSSCPFCRRVMVSCEKCGARGVEANLVLP